MNEYRGKHAPSQPWAIASSAYMPVRRGRHQKKNRRRRIRVILLCLLVLLVLAYPFLESRIVIADLLGQFVDKHPIASAELPEKANHLKVVFVTDIHWGFWFSDSDLKTLIKKINNLHPNIVIFGGDYATDQTSAIAFFRKLKEEMPTIGTQYGMWGVLGECDHAGDDPAMNDIQLRELKEAMIDAGVTPVINEVVSIPFGEGPSKSFIYIAGLDDPINGKTKINDKSSISHVAGQLREDQFVIFVCHNPSVINEAQRTKAGDGSLRWIDLGLFGHTHGGQMTFFGDLLGIAEDVPDDRAKSGWLNENKAKLLISRGVGTAVVPFRLFCFPQIHCIEITCGN